MVNRGRGRIGALVSLLLVAVVLYYGIPVVKLYWDYYKLLDEMRVNARFSQSLTDEDLLRRLRTTVDALELPPEAKRFVLRREAFPPTILIRTEYRKQIELPFHHRFITFRPSVEMRL